MMSDSAGRFFYTCSGAALHLSSQTSRGLVVKICDVLSTKCMTHKLQENRYESKMKTFHSTKCLQVHSILFMSIAERAL